MFQWQLVVLDMADFVLIAVVFWPVVAIRGPAVPPPLPWHPSCLLPLSLLYSRD